MGLCVRGAGRGQMAKLYAGKETRFDSVARKTRKGGVILITYYLDWWRILAPMLHRLPMKTPARIIQVSGDKSRENRLPYYTAGFE